MHHHSTTMLELYIWGPAFGLPSIEPECLAALSYLAYVVPRQDWILIAGNDVTVSPDQILPALHHIGVWISGYLNIVSYLTKHTSYSSEHDLSSTQRANSLANGSYLNSRGSALLAAALYASPSAWSEVTRPAYSSLLPFPLTWTIPLNLRSAAIAKMEQLGLDLSVDSDAEDMAKDPKTMAPTTSTGFLRLHNRPSLSSTWQPEQASAIRLHKLAEDFFSVLTSFRGESDYFLGSDWPTSLDFLVLGYLELMRVKTPHPFLADVMNKTATGTQLKDFLRIMHEGPVRWEQDKSDGLLPWSDPAPRTVVGTTGRFADGVAGHIPGVGGAWKKWWHGGVKDDQKHDTWDIAQIAMMVSGIVAGFGAVGGAVVFNALSPFGAPMHRFEPPWEKKTGLHQFGEIGAMFDNLPQFQSRDI